LPQISRRMIIRFIIRSDKLAKWRARRRVSQLGSCQSACCISLFPASFCLLSEQRYGFSSKMANDLLIVSSLIAAGFLCIAHGLVLCFWRNRRMHPPKRHCENGVVAPPFQPKRRLSLAASFLRSVVSALQLFRNLFEKIVVQHRRYGEKEVGADASAVEYAVYVGTFARYLFCQPARTAPLFVKHFLYSFANIHRIFSVLLIYLLCKVNMFFPLSVLPPPILTIVKERLDKKTIAAASLTTQAAEARAAVALASAAVGMLVGCYRSISPPLGWITTFAFPFLSTFSFCSCESATI